MYFQRFVSRPAPGKASELRAAIEERVKARQRQGLAVGLQASLISLQGAAFVAVERWEDLAKLEQNRARALSSPDFQAFQAKIAGLLSAPVAVLLFELLVPPAAAAPPARYLTRFSFRPAVGKGPELREVLVDCVKALQAHHPSTGLQSRLFDPEGPAFTMVSAYEDLGAWERERSRRRNDADFRAFEAKIAALLSRPPASMLFEVLVPLPQ